MATSPPTAAGRNVVPLCLSALLALGLHVGALFGCKTEPTRPGFLEVEGDQVEVELLAPTASEVALQSSQSPPTLPTAAEPMPEQSPAEQHTPEQHTPEQHTPEQHTPEQRPPEQRPPEPAVPPPLPEPPLLPQPQPPAMPQALPQAPTPEPVKTLSPPPKAAPIRETTRTSALGTTETRPQPAGDAGVRGAGKPLGKPLYVVRPQVKYPPASRAAQEEGVVILRITVNAEGRPTAVDVAVSSTFSRLDRAAVEGGWKCRVSNAFEGAQFEAPMRFSLKG